MNENNYDHGAKSMIITFGFQLIRRNLPVIARYM